MSQFYKWNIDVSPCTKRTAKCLTARLGIAGYTPDGFDWFNGELRAWGEQAMSGGADASERHAEIKKALGPKYKVALRLRCTEYDEWDDEIDDNDEGDMIAVEGAD